MQCNRFLKQWRTVLSLIFFAVVAVGIMHSGVVSAQTDTFGVAQINSNVALGNADIRITIARIIRVALSLLGTIALGIVLYGGFVYMTAGGDEEKIGTAKKILINGTIGLVIILTSWGITQFVLKKLSSAINPNGTTGQDPPISVCDQTSPDYNYQQCTYLCSIHAEYSVCSTQVFYVKSITPSTPGTNNGTGMNNISFRVIFSHPISSATILSQAVRVVQNTTGADVTLSLSLKENNYVVEAVAMNGTQPVAAGSYTIKVNPELKDTAGGSLQTSAGGKEYPLTATVLVDKEVNDTTVPSVSPVLINGQGTGAIVYLGQNILFSSLLKDRVTGQGGIGYGSLTIRDVSDSSIVRSWINGPAVSVGSAPDYTFSYLEKILAPTYQTLKTYRATVVGYDIDHNLNQSSADFTVYGALCNNGKQDGDETGIDIGGSCGGGSGATCSTNAQCSVGFKCLQNKCTLHPEITGVSPMHGAVGSWVSIAGKNFGTIAGTVSFSKDAGNTQWVEAKIVQCGTTASWHNDWVVVEVPPGTSASSAIKLTLQNIAATSTALFDTTIDDFGPKPNGDGLFIVDNTTHPGLCKVAVTANTSVKIGNKDVTILKDAEAAPSTVPVTAYGTGFGSKQTNASLISFGGIQGAILNWLDTQINSKIPDNIKAGPIGVSVTADGVESNAVKFSILSASDLDQIPVITSVDPASTTLKSFITIHGTGFGSNGQVFLAKNIPAAQTCDSSSPDASCVRLNTNKLPAYCGTTWSDTQIIAEVSDIATEKISFGTYAVLVKNNSGLKSNDSVFLTINSGGSLPSICRLEPAAGPAPLSADSDGLTLSGINFTGNPIVLFWRRGADPQDYNTWLNSSKDTYNNLSIFRSIDPTGKSVKFVLPVNKQGLSMDSGDIRIQANGSVSNGIKYTVTDCRTAPVGSNPGYQCCTEGPDAGQYKPNGFMCAGESRDAGYVWRFTTGIIPDLPRVVEECKSGSFPSPTPRKVSGVADNACLNGTVALRFTTTMDPATLSGNNVKLYTCADNNGVPDCSNKKPVENLLLGIQNSNQTVLKILDGTKTPLTANQWYHVELSDAIRSKQAKKILGKEVVVSEALQKTKPCGQGTSFCFDFKTGSNQCVLKNAGILPPDYTTTYLGVIQSLLYPFDVAGDPFNVSHPFYYYLWGEGDQACSVLGVDGLGWQWGSNQPEKALPAVAPGTEYNITYTDSRATVAAKDNSAPQKVTLSAETDILNPNTAFSIGGTDVLALAGIQPGITVLPKQNKLVDSGVSPIVQLSTPFSLELHFMLQQPTSLAGGGTVTMLAEKYGSYALMYYAAAGADTFGLCFVTENASGQFGTSVCSNEKPEVGNLYHYIITWDGKILRFFGKDGKETAAKPFVGMVSNTKPLDFSHPSSPSVEVAWQLFRINQNVVSQEFAASILHADTLTNQVVRPTSTLMVNLGDPEVVYFEPNCAESCVNASIAADFNRMMATSTYSVQNAFTVFTCNDDANCAQKIDEGIFGVDIDASSPYRLVLNPQVKLKPNTYYRVELSNKIKALATFNPPILGKSLKPFVWTFRTQNNATPCAPQSVAVKPSPYTAIAIGEKTKYVAFPYSSPNACSKLGQALNRWDYGYAWSTVGDQKVATVSNYSTSNGFSAQCTMACLPKGSSTDKKDLALCGNGTVEAGEDCEVGTPGCTYSCLFDTATAKASGLTGSSPLQNFDAKTGTAWCGDGKVGPGEACDTAIVAGQGIDPKTTGVGCSNNCLHTGTQLTRTWCDANMADINAVSACNGAVSVCGNGTLESGEECEIKEDKVFVSGNIETNAPVSACNSQCILTGNICSTNVPAPLKCTKGTEGCTKNCTLAGSSPWYKNDSLCGDGKVGTGENAICELPPVSATTAAGPTQIVTAIGEGTLIPGLQIQTTKISASITDSKSNAAGSGDYTLQCGFTEFAEAKKNSETGINLYNDCPKNIDNHLGVSSNSCCAPRPVRVATYPVDGQGFGSEAVCRNSQVSVSYATKIAPDTLKDTIKIVRGYAAGTACSSSTIDVSASINNLIAATPPGGAIGFWQKIWQSIKHFFLRIFGADALASQVDVVALVKPYTVWCAGEISLTADVVNMGTAGSVTSTVNIAIDSAFAPSTVYGVWIKGGKNGLKSEMGVSIKSPDYASPLDDIWFFKTGTDICKIESVAVAPATALYTKKNTDLDFTAQAITKTGQKIQSTAEYAWDWAWQPVKNPVFTIPAVTTAVNTISSKEVEGHINAVAEAVIKADNTVGNNQNGKVISGMFDLSALFCEHPWPAAEQYPFVDSDYNFSMGYCADEGKSGVTVDDLPYLIYPGQTFLPGGAGSNTFAPGTLKKTLFFTTDAGNEDVIGVQVFSANAGQSGEGLSLVDWYKQKFETLGAMKPTTVGGFSALTDGNNYYVKGLNYKDGDNKIYGNIYLFSINENAQAATKKVFEQLINSLDFNTNLTDHNLCILSGQGGVRSNPNSVSDVSCASDFDCHVATTTDALALPGTNGICSNAKTKFFRDWTRLHDIQDAQEKIKAYTAQAAGTPDFKGDLKSGSYIPGYTGSRWPSWGTFGSLIGGQNGNLPSDPLNLWSTCASADQQTCWNVASSTFACPKLSSVYEYEYVSSTGKFIFHAPFEFLTTADPIMSDFVDLTQFSTDRWFGCKDAAAFSPNKTGCGDGVVGVGEQCDPPGAQKISLEGGENVSYLCNNQCQWQKENAVAVAQCPNGKIEPGEICDDGALNGTYGHCAKDCQGTGLYCGDGQKDPVAEFCDASVPGTNYKNGYDLKKENSCAWDCKGYGGYCGDGVTQKDQGEECDDKNTTSQDGCSNQCKKENVACLLQAPQYYADDQAQYADIYLTRYDNQTLLKVNGSHTNKPGFYTFASGYDQIAQCFSAGSTGTQICRAAQLSCAFVNKVTTCVVGGKGCIPYAGINTLQQDIGCDTDLSVAKQDDPKDTQYSVSCTGGIFKPLASSTPPSSSINPQCGNGKIDKGEQCDDGKTKNGLECTPEYGKSCTYCTAQCTIGTKDKVAYCGNGKLDVIGKDASGNNILEACETANDIVYNNPIKMPLQCGDVGTYQCANNCTELINSCVECRMYDNKIAGQVPRPIPQITLLNPLIGNGQNWPEKSGYVDLLRKPSKSNGGNPFLSWSILAKESGQFRDPTKPHALNISSTTIPIADEGLEANPQCNGSYKLFFNYRSFTKKSFDYNNFWPEYYEALSNPAPGYMSGDIFDYPVNGEQGYINNTVLVMPAVPWQEYRIVVRWKPNEVASGPMVSTLFDTNQTQNPQIYNFTDYLTQNATCNTIATTTIDGEIYWDSVASDNQHSCQSFGPSAKFSDFVSAAGEQVQALSFSGTSANYTSHQPFAFLVQGLAGSIFQDKYKNITVEVYGHHLFQNGLDSVYKPIATFSIKDAAGSSTNAVAKFWHPFDVVYDPSSVTSFKYVIKPVNKIQTNICQVAKGMPNVDTSVCTD